MAEDNGLGVEFKYLIVNDMDRKFGLWVNTVGYQSIPPDSPYPLKEHSVSKKQDFEMSDVDQKIEQAKIIMNENVAGNVDPEELAMRLNINYSWFRRVFKEYTGYAPAKYFQELKLRKAKQLLVGTSQSVKEILFFLVSSLPNTSFLFLRSVQGLLRWSIVRLGEKSEFIIYQRNI